MEIDDVLLTMCAGQEKEAKAAFAWLYQNCWEEVLLVLKAKDEVLGLDLNDKKSAVNTAFQQLWVQAQAGKIKNMDKDPRALLHTLAYRRAIDLLRRNTAKKRHMTPEELEEFRLEAVQESSFDYQWNILEMKGLAKEVIDDFFTWLKQQKGVCRRTALAMAEFLPDLATPNELHAALCENLDPPPTKESVKKARADVLTKFKLAIKSKYEGMWR